MKIDGTFQFDNPHFVNHVVLPFIFGVFQPLALLTSKFAMRYSAVAVKYGDAALQPSTRPVKLKHPEIEEDSKEEVAFPFPAKQEKVVFFLPFMAIDFHWETLISS
ncbi:MAG TPA: hypothetical protein VK709_17085 [Candidatus Saccharimonadales bacterium]|nr:hypothetical protein [Candidatus Saccharimonadales bacterium]